jgi:glycosyltransferase involved in cell wall biosynthesis
MKVTAVIPARNEEQNIGRVIDACREFVDEVVVIIGNSSDATDQVARRHGARVVHQTTKGKGGAIVESRKHVDGGVMVFIDADQSHDPSGIPLLTAPILAQDADMVIASRMLGGSDELFTGVREFIRLMGGHILTLLIAKRFKYPLTDSQNGFRAIRAEVLEDLHLSQESFTIEMEMCIEALRRGYTVLEVPAHEYRRSSGASNINPLKLGPLYVFVCLRGIAKRNLKPTVSPTPALLDRYRPRWKDAL